MKERFFLANHVGEFFFKAIASQFAEGSTTSRPQRSDLSDLEVCVELAERRCEAQNE